MTVEILLRDQADQPLEALGNLIYQQDGETRAIATETDADGRLRFGGINAGSELLIAFFRSGFWTLRLDGAQLPDVLVCPQLPSCQGAMWWHKVLGFDEPDPAAGKGIRIGVVDQPFAVSPGLEHVSVSDVSGKPLFPELGALPTHGEAVCRLVAQRMPSPSRFGGIAPSSTLVFVGAGRGVEGGSLNPAEVASAIIRLARDFRCDLINLSAGRRQPTPGIHQAICEAREYGALCVVAAGNEPYDSSSFPARYGECIGVGAIGLKDWGPDYSFARHMSDLARENGSSNGRVADYAIFHYPRSAYGEGLDVVAPGVGLIIDRGEGGLLDVAGTSFACPLVTGLLAVHLARLPEYAALPRDAERAAAAERQLRSICRRTGLEAQQEGLGLPRLK